MVEMAYIVRESHVKLVLDVGVRQGSQLCAGAPKRQSTEGDVTGIEDARVDIKYRIDPW